MGLFALLTRFLPRNARREYRPQFAYAPLPPRRLEPRRVLDAAGAGVALGALADLEPYVQAAPLAAEGVTADQQAPSVTLQGGPQVDIRLRDAQLFEDQSTLAVISISDSQPLAHEVTIDWGDGSALQVIVAGPNQRDVLAAHRYLDDPASPGDGTFTITVSVKNSLGEEGFAAATVTVLNVAPQLDSLAIDAVIQENGIATLTGTYSDVGSLDTHTLDIDWDGDGQYDESVAVTGGSFSVSRQFLDDDPTGTASDTFNVNVRLSDDDGGEALGSVQLTVENVAPVLTLEPGIISIFENGTAVLVGTYTDVGSLDTHELDIDWNGDGLFDETVAVSGGTFQVSRQFLDDDPSGTPVDTTTVIVRLRDDDGGASTAFKTLEVMNVSPVLSLLPVGAIDENGFATLTGTINDPGTLDTFRLGVMWGDPATPGNFQIFNLDTVPLTKANDGIDWDPTTRQFSIERQYLDDGPSGTPLSVYTIRVAVVDDDGGFGSEITTVTVRNVAPVLTVAVDQTIDEGATLDLGGGQLGSFTDVGTLDTHTATVDWGDGTGTQSVVVDQGTGFGSLSASHVYADNGTYTVTVTVIDDDLGSDTRTFEVTVLNVDPFLTGVDSPLGVREGQIFSLSELGVGLADPGFTNPLAGSHETLTAVEVDWGDGTVQQLALGPQVDGQPGTPTTAPFIHDPYAYADNGTYTVKITVHDDDGSMVTRQFTVLVENVDPTLSLALDLVEIDEGDSINLSGIFSDPGYSNDNNPQGPTVESFHYSIDWGDGTLTQNNKPVASVDDGKQGTPTTGTLIDSHTYLDNDEDNYYTITVTLFDDDGGSVTEQIQIRVLNVNPSLDALTATDVTTGGFATVTVMFDDPGADTFVVHIDWGDGKPDAISFDRDVTSLPHTFVHQYEGPPNPANPAADIIISVYVTDDDFGVPGVVEIGRSATRTVAISSPGIGAEPFRIDTTPRVPQLAFPVREVPVFVVNQAAIGFTGVETFDLGGSAGETRVTGDRYVELRVIDAEGNEGPGYRLRPEVLRDLPALFRTLPDNHYAVYVVNTETDTRRLVIEVFVRNGKLIDPGDDSEGTRDRPPTDEQTSVTDEDAAEDVPVGSPAAEPGLSDGATAVPTRIAPVPFSRWSTIAIGLAASSAAQSWAQRVDQALAKATADQWRKLQSHNRPRRK